MARLGVSPVFKAFDSDGSVLNAGVVYTYITGTSTPKNTWSDQAEATGAAASFTLDAYGEAVRYFDTDAAYKLVIRDSSGTTIRTIDPYVPVPIMTQLDENLDVNGKSIISSANGDINITPNGTGDLILDGLKWPQADGTIGQAIKTDGAAQLSWVSLATNVVDDATPQLGADLDTNTYNIQFDGAKGILDDAGNEQVLFQKTTSAVNYLDITNAATSTGPTIAAAGSDTNIGLNIDGKGSGAVVISGLSYPTADGTSGQGVTTDGAGLLAFGTAINEASQAEMEAGTSSTVFATPAVINHAPGSCKGWIHLSPAAVDNGSYNVVSTVDNSTANYTINWDTDFSSTYYSIIGTCVSDTTHTLIVTAQAVGSCTVVMKKHDGATTESGLSSIMVVAQGDQ